MIKSILLAIVVLGVLGALFGALLAVVIVSVLGIFIPALRPPQASMLCNASALKLRLVSIMPLGRPVVPPLYRIAAVSSGAVRQTSGAIPLPAEMSTISIWTDRKETERSPV